MGQHHVSNAFVAGAAHQTVGRCHVCPECGALNSGIDGVERRSVLTECGFVHWDNPVPVVLIEYQGRIVLARNSQWPDGMFSLVTGYLERNETPEEAVVREVKEELGLDSKAQEFIGCYSLIEKNQIILAHWVVATGELTTGGEITEVKLLSREELKLWQFGRLALTSAIVNQWLEKTTPNNSLQPTSALTRRRG
jgi:NADH pyrophosphatase NudC (nudix superfamily)